jgi:hypothetical protein
MSVFRRAEARHPGTSEDLIHLLLITMFTIYYFWAVGGIPSFEIYTARRIPMIMGNGIFIGVSLVVISGTHATPFI